ncbi:photosystem II reaction center protein Ycf12/Psb30 [Merismopedia glauca]|nr:photosystem II reaction center protein Ycf12 [Merismopedia glauca]
MPLGSFRDAVVERSPKSNISIDRGGKMELIGGMFSFLDGIFSFFNNINFETIAQLTMLAMIVIAGPAIVFLLAASRGNL